MGRGRVAIRISMPPELAREFDRLAKTTAKSRSELFREMFEAYYRAQPEEDFGRLQRYGARKARAIGVLTERDVERIVFEDR